MQERLALAAVIETARAIHDQACPCEAPADYVREMSVPADLIDELGERLGRLSESTADRMFPGVRAQLAMLGEALHPDE